MYIGIIVRKRFGRKEVSRKKVSIRWDRRCTHAGRQTARTFTLESLEIVCHVLPRLAVANGEILSQSMIKWRDSRRATRSFKSSPREWLVEGKHRLGSFLETRPWMSCAFLASDIAVNSCVTQRRGEERRLSARNFSRYRPVRKRASFPLQFTRPIL